MSIFFQSSVELPASPQDVFAFHENPKNITLIAPSSLQVIRVEAGTRAIVGEKFSLLLKQFGFRMEWIGCWERVESGRLLVDIAEKSPFAAWRHSHIFEPCAMGCRMTDRIECRFGGGIFGKAISPFMSPLVFGPMFRARHAATRAYFTK